MLTRSLVLHRCPEGPLALTDFRIQPKTLPKQPTVLLRPHYISVDPYMRTRMHTEGYHYIDRLHPGSTLSGWTLAEVLSSRHSEYLPGDWVVGHLPMQELVATSGEGLIRLTQGTDPKAYLHPLGMTGFTAWVGMQLLGQPTPQDTVLVNAAAGAVGSLAAQLAKLSGARVIVTAGREDKRAWLHSLGFHDVLNHRAIDYSTQLKAACPKGITLGFENVGGQAFSATIETMQPQGRIVLCGLISQYQTHQPRRSPANLASLRPKQVPIHPFVVPDFMRYWPTFQQQMAQHLAAEQLSWKLDVLQGGLDSIAPALIGLFQGDNLGKRVVSML